MTDVYFYEVFKEEEEAIKNFLPKNITAKYTRKSIQELRHKNPPAKLISIRTQSSIPSAWTKKLKGILTRSQGYDHLVRYRRETAPDAPCGYLGNYCARAVAEQAVLSMLVLYRRLPTQMKNFKRFNRDGLTGFECKGRNALVVGVGNIGSQIVDLATGLNMFVKGVDIKKKIKRLQYTSLEKGIQWADVVFCALPLTDKTRNMLNYKVLQKANSGLIFVNISRAEISPIEDLKKLLKEDILAGLSLDIYPSEERLASYLKGKSRKKDKNIDTVLALEGNDNVLFTPHNAFNTYEALEEKSKRSAESAVYFLKKGRFPYPVPAE